MTAQIAKTSPRAVLIVVSNPLDAMVYTAWKISDFPTNRVVGQAGCLDIARYRTFIAMELDCSVADIDALLMGGHGDDMVPLPRYTSVAGIPVTQLIAPDKLDAIIQRTRMGGGEIVKDKRRILPCAAYCDQEYGIGGCFVGVPCVLGSNGVEKILEVELAGEERELLDASVNHVKETVALAEKYLG